MLLKTDLTEFIITIINSILDLLYSLFIHLDDIIIIDGQRFGLPFVASFLDFFIGSTVVGIVVGLFIRINKADNYFHSE